MSASDISHPWLTLIACTPAVAQTTSTFGKLTQEKSAREGESRAIVFPAEVFSSLKYTSDKTAKGGVSRQNILYLEDEKLPVTDGEEGGVGEASFTAGDAEGGVEERTLELEGAASSESPYRKEVKLFVWVHLVAQHMHTGVAQGITPFRLTL